MNRSEKGEPITLERGPSRGDSFELVIEELGTSGLGLARIDALVGPQEQAIRYRIEVRHALPGDHVEVEVTSRRKREVSARITRTISSSPARVAPRCQHVGLRSEAGKGCGGCTIQTMAYPAQLDAKRHTIQTLFSSQGLDSELVATPIAMDEPWYYRNKMEFSIGDNPHDTFAIGLHPSGYKHDVLDLKECWLLSPFVAAFLPVLSAWAHQQGLEPYKPRHNEGFLRTLTVREGKRTGERLLELVTTAEPQAMMGGEMTEARVIAERLRDEALRIAREIDTPISSFYWTQHDAKQGQRTRFLTHHLHGDESLHEQLDLPGDQSLRFAIHPRAFFQPNTRQAEVLYTHVLRAAGLLDDQRERPRCILDLYCGTGTIGLCCAPYTQRVVGIELHEGAVESARQNAAYNDIEHVSFLVGDVGKVLANEQMMSEAFGSDGLDHVDVIIVDPPRAGLSTEALDHVLSVGASRIVYVSCNPASLARDLARLRERDVPYQIEYVQPVDMFPHTYHIENVALLTRRDM